MQFRDRIKGSGGHPVREPVFVRAWKGEKYVGSYLEKNRPKEEKMIKVWLNWRNFTVRLAVLAVAAAFLVFPGAALAGFQGERVLESRPVAEGLVLEKRAVTAGGSQVLIYILRADLGNPYLKINTLVGSGGTLEKNAAVTGMAGGAGAVAAVNADFFQMAESGRPIGMTYRDGKLITSPPLRDDMPGWSVNRAGVPAIEVFKFSGGVTAKNGAQFPLNGINKPSYIESGEKNSHQDSLLLYNRFWGPVSRGRIGGSDSVTEVFVNNGTVSEILVNQPGKSIPENGFVLAGRGKAAEFIKSNLKVGDMISVNYSVTPDGDKIWAGTGGWSLLVDQGRAMANFPGDINGFNARTAIGYSRGKNSLLVITVEKSAASRGLTLNELAEYLVSLNVERVLNLDGGGSTTLAARPLGEEKPVLVNTPQRNIQRLVPTAIGFFSSAPRGSLSGIILGGPDAVFPGDTASFTVKGYDSHYNPYPMSGERVEWSLVSGPGSFSGNVFTATGSGTAVIAAKSGGVQATASVKVLGSQDLKGITPVPGSISVRPGATASLAVNAVGLDGTVYPLSPRNYTATVDPGLGRLENAIFTAAEVPAAGGIKISMGDLAVMVPVAVRYEDQAIYKFVPGQGGTLTLGDFSASFPGGAFGGPVTVSAFFGGELAAPVPGRYKTVSTITLKTMEGGPADLADAAAVTWKIQPGEAGKMAVLQLQRGGWQQIPSRLVEKDNLVASRIRELSPLALVRDEQPAAAEFKDMTGHWAEKPVLGLAAAGVVSGYPGNKFNPDGRITRSEFVVMICRALGWQPAQGEGRFKDQAAMPAWAGGYVLAAAGRGAVSGYEDGTFRPANPVTRAEMAAMISRALSLPAGEKAGPAEIFSDGASVPAWAAGPVSGVYAAGIMKGDRDKKFRPGDRATRAESAAMMYSVLDYLFSR